MPLPDKHANEPTIEVDADIYKALLEAKQAVDAWTKEYNRLKARMQESIGSAYAATVNGEKVLTYRPKESYAQASLIKDYPDLTQHYFELQVENTFNMAKFSQDHPEIAEKYRVRALVEVKGQ